MAAADALDVLVDPANIVKNTVTIPEGLRVTDIVDVLAEEDRLLASAASRRCSTTPTSSGLPDYAEGNPEGYLFPATYDFGPRRRPTSILTTMVDRWQQAADDADLEETAAELGYTPGELMTVASLVEAEGRGEDTRQGRAGHLQPARGPRRDERAAPDRRHGQLRARPELGRRA